MKTPIKKYFLASFLAIVSLDALAGTNPPAPAGAPVGPGFPIDQNIFILMFFGIILAFICLKRYSRSNKNA